ncbi:MAG: hypothetical protein GY731_08300, partial [Gammaproteobacteria bacterium]|nr:hypothetical protein [Gammaproteobacteria bacterium]
FEGHSGGVYSAVFDGPGERVVSAGRDGTVRLWDTRTGEELRRFEGHSDWVNSAVFDGPGERVVSAGDDGTVRLWGVGVGGGPVLLCAPTPGGWLSLDRAGRYRAGGDGLEYLSYSDPDEHALLPTLWRAEDLPELAAGE